MTNKDQEKLVELLSQLEPGFLPYPVFKQLARILVMPIIEFVPVRKDKNGDVEVLLIQRSADDDIWPNEWHTPGTVVRATDLDNDVFGAFKRILHEEMGDIKVSAPYYVGSRFYMGKRGAEMSQIYWIEVKNEPKEGKFFNINNLPKDTMHQQLNFIKEACENYAKYSKLV